MMTRAAQTHQAGRVFETPALERHTRTQVHTHMHTLSSNVAVKLHENESLVNHQSK